MIFLTKEDRLEDSIGFRQIETRVKEILLNGKPVFLRGITMHKEAPRPGLFPGGRLLNWSEELGCNLVRLVHYPYTGLISNKGQKKQTFFVLRKYYRDKAPPTNRVVRLLRAPETPTRICKACFQASGS